MPLFAKERPAVPKFTPGRAAFPDEEVGRRVLADAACVCNPTLMGRAFLCRMSIKA